jgi:hypothetical protein
MTSLLRRSASAALVAALLLAAPLWSGCDASTPDGPVFADAGIRVATFELNDRDNRDNFYFSRTFSTSDTEAQYEATDYPGVTSLLTEAAVDGGVVLLYASDVVNGDGLMRRGWTALPLTVGFDVTGDNFVDYVLTTTYTFDVRRLYVNLIASDAITLTDDLLDQFEAVRLRLVVIPGALARPGVDYSDYRAVQRAYGLAE